MRPLAALLAILLLAPSVAAWGQLRGEADRSAAIDPPRGTLDVVSWDQIAGSGTIQGQLSPYAVSGPEGLTVLINAPGGRCQLVTWRPGGPAVPTTVAPQCQNAWLQGYWAQGDLVLVCRSGPGTTEVLSAFSPDGAYAWGIAPNRDLGLDAGALGAQDWSWTCQGAAILEDEGVALVPFLATQTGSDGSVHRIAKIDLTAGSPVWSRSVPPPAALNALEAVGIVDADAANPSFLPLSVAAIESGLMVSGLVSTDVYCPAAECPDPEDTGTRATGGVAWMDQDGDTQSFEVPRPRDDVSPESGEPVQVYPLVSSFGAGEGSLIAAQVGGRILIVDPTTPNLEADVPTTVRESGASLAWWTGPLWQHQRLVVPTERSLTFLDPVSFAPLPSPPGPDTRTERIVDLAGDRLGRLFVLIADVTGDTTTAGIDVGTSATVRILDSAGEEQHELPLPAITRVASDPIFTSPQGGEEGFLWLQAPMFIEHDGSLVVMDAAGSVFVLADRDETPAVAISDAYPASGDEVTIDVARFGDPAEVLIRWGDGTTESSAWNATTDRLEASHLYVEPDRVNLLVTVIQEDRTTATTSVPIDVGGSPPPDLNFVQRAFSPQYVDTTWGIIGILVAVVGALYGLWRLRSGRRRLRLALEEIDDARDLGARDPMAALRTLKDIRGRFLDEAAIGLFDQGQVHVLERRAASTARALFYLCIEDFRDRMSPTYQALHASFFEDGRIGEHEAAAALRGLDAESELTQRDQAVVKELFGSIHP